MPIPNTNTSLPAMYHGLYFIPSHSLPWSAVNGRTQTVQAVIVRTALTAVSSIIKKISDRVSRPRKISPDNDITQYMQISPNSQ